VLSLDLDVREGKEGVTVRAGGGLDIVTVEAFRSAVDALLDLGHALRLDLSELDFIDSQGILALVDVVKRGAGRVTISDDLRPEVRRVLSITGIIRTLPLHPSSAA
jgi:anti-anti-sigma factor